MAMGLFVVGVFVFVTMFSGFNLTLTGYAVFSDGVQGEFDSGSYFDVVWNGSAVVLSGDNLTGNYVSQVFDAGNDAVWNNISWIGQVVSPLNSYLTSAIYSGTNQTDVFGLDESYYLADMKDSSKKFYLDFSENLINGTILKIYAKKDKGVTIGIYAQSDVNGDTALGSFTVESATGDWYNITLDISVPTNAIWIGEGAESGVDPKDEFDYIYAEILGTTLDVQIKSCDNSECSGESWTDIIDTSPQDLSVDNNRYFQYKVEFASPDTSITSSLVSMDVDYTESESDSPIISYSSITTAEGTYSNKDNIDVGVDLSDESQIYSFINFNNSLVGFWKMDDVSGIITDYSGFSNNGTNNGADYQAGGKFGSAMSFDGVGDYVDLGNINNFERTDLFSYSFWMKTDSIVDYITVISKTPYGSWQGMELFVVNNKLRFYLLGGVGGGQIDVGSTAGVNNDVWNHIVITYNGTSKADDVMIYVNGVEGSYKYGDTLVGSIDNPNNFQISGRAGSNNCFDGLLDEVLVFNRVLSSNEISNLYDASSYSRNFIELGYETYDFYAYSQDVYGNEAQTSERTITLSENAPPVLELVYPQDGNTYGYNTSIALDFLASDVDDNLDSCWYNFDDGENITLTDCANITFDIVEGSYDLNIYANDSFGLEVSDSVNFNVQVGAPTISLHFPVDIYLNDGQEVVFNYTPVDVDLDSCWLLGDFTGVYGVNQTDDSPTSGIVNNFYLDLSDGIYEWNVECNDDEGNSASNGNKTFYVDTTNPSLSLTEPSGVKTTRVSIPLTFSVSDDSPLTCYYNITTSVGTEVVSDVEVEDCLDGSFDVSADGDYVVNFWVVDSAGNLNESSSEFSVDTEGGSVVVVTPTGGSSGGGGGGSFSFPLSVAKLEVGAISAIVSIGEEKSLVANVKNVGKVSANKCSLVSEGGGVDSSDIFNIGVGEIVDFGFVLSVSESVLDLEMSVVCLDNVSVDVPLDIIILRPELDISIEEISIKSDNEISIGYVIEPSDSGEKILYFRIIDSDGAIVKEQKEEVSLVFGESYRGEVLLDISGVSEGMLKISVGGEDEVNFVEEDFVYGGSNITGFASFNVDGNMSYIGVIVLVFLVLAGFLIRRIWKLKKGK